MTDALDTALDALGRVPSPLGWDDVARRTARTPSPEEGPAPGRSRRRPILVAVAAAAIVVAGTIGLWPDQGGEDVRTRPGPDRSTVTPSTTSEQAATPTTGAGPTTIPAVESSRGQTVVTAVTDDTYLVWGGEDGTGELDRVDGFAVDLETSTVTAIPPAPIDPAGGGSGGWTGTELVVWSALAPGCAPCTGAAPEAAAWDPVAREWRRIAPPPADVTSPVAGTVWAGDRLVTVGRAEAAAYDPGADTWSEVPPVPGIGDAGPLVDMVWTGEEVVAWSPATYGGPYPADEGGPVADVGWRWAPGATEWIPLPDLPPGSRTSLGSMTWTGEEVVVWGAATGGAGAQEVGVGARWRPGDDVWRPMAPSPQGAGDGFEGTQGSQALAADTTTGRIVVHPLDLGGGIEERAAYLYDPMTDTWAFAGFSLGGYAPPVSFDAGLVLRPDATSPVIGPI